MDMNSLIGTLMSEDSLNGISRATSTSSEETRSVLSAALPLLLSGAQAQSQNANTSAGFGNALFSHGQQNTGNVSVFLQGVDLSDGGKIIAHLLGANNTSAINQISQQTGVSTQSTGNILSAVAPLLMSLLGQQLGSNNAGASSSTVAAMATSLMQNMDVGSLLSGLLAGTTTNQTQTNQKKQGLLGSLLNGLLKG